VTLSGRVGDHYEIVRLLGSGAMGEVYRATDRKMFDRTVAIKFLSEGLTNSEEGRLRFRREVETSARLHHPNIVTIYDWGEHLGRDYFVMEFVDGRDLQGLLKAGVSWDLEMRLEVAFQIADALEFAHRAGVIHRDIKPGNVMVVLSDSGPRVKLVDFGIAHVDRSNLTLTQSHPGTYAYMSPEQLRGEKDLDSRSDLFSLGIVFGELFTGHHPFEAVSEAMISSRVLRDEPDRPSRHRNDLPPDLEALILRMLAKDAGERPVSAREVADALRELLRKAMARSAGADPSFTALDDLERQLVESLVSWARQKETEGAPGDALAAYEKASRLAPESEWIQRKVPELTRRTEEQRLLNAELRELERQLESDRAPEARESLRKAMALSPDDPRLAAYESRINALEAVTPEAREREQFVAPRMKEIDAALDAGNIGESMALLSEVLRKYPDQADAAVMLERLIEVAKGDIAYGDYRAAVRDAWTRLKAGDVDAATVACERATVLWPAGPEAQTLEAAIVAARDDARRRAKEAEAEKRREEAERVRRQNEVLERYLDGARNLVRDAQTIAPASPGETRRAIEAFGKAVKALDLILTERPDHPAAGATRREVSAEVATLEKRLAEQEASAEPEPEAPREAERHPPARRSRIAAAASVGVIVLALLSFAAWKMIPRPFDKEMELALHLSESSEKEVSDKLQRIRAIDALLPPGDARKENLARQEERLLNLDEMYRDIERLDVLLRGAAGSAGEPGGSARLVSDAENVLNLLRGFRGALEADDPTAILLEKKGQAIVAEIKDRTGR
jgi:serine/threonine protein kinase